MSTGYQRAALTLSALSRRDRQWILGNLALEERRQLVDAMSEFRRSGLRLRPAELDALLQEGDTPQIESQTDLDATNGDETAQTVEAAEQAAPRSNDPLNKLRAATPTDLFYVFANEPDWLIAAVTSAANWPWRNEFFALMGNERATRIRRYMKQRPNNKPMLSDALVAVVSQRLASRQDSVGFTVAMDEAHETMANSASKSGWKARLSSWLL